MALPSVFLSSVTVDYAAARLVYQSFCEQEIPCFFCDEALLRAGDPVYRSSMVRALRTASHLVVIIGQASHIDSKSVQEVLEEFGSAHSSFHGSRPVIMMLGAGVDPEDLAGSARVGRMLSFPEQMDTLHRLVNRRQELLESPREAGIECLPGGAQVKVLSNQKNRRFLWAVTLLNAGLFCLSGWMLQRAAGLAGILQRAVTPQEGTRLHGATAGASDEDDLTRLPEFLARKQDVVSGSAPPPARHLTGFSSKALTADQLAAVRPGAPVRMEIGNLYQDFSYIPAGTFLMGSPLTEAGRKQDEAQRRVTIPAGFWLARTECAQDLWTRIVGSTPEDPCSGPGLPIRSIHWDQITGKDTSFLTVLNQMDLLPEGWMFDIPNEAQWEYACRAGTATSFYFGNVLDGIKANCDGRLAYGTSAAGPFLNQVQPIASYLANGWGLHDMHGNLAEWCRPLPELSVSYPDDPPSAAEENRPIERGGSWRFHAGLCRSASRETAGGMASGDNVGFRLAIVAVR